MDLFLELKQHTSYCDKIGKLKENKGDVTVQSDFKVYTWIKERCQSKEIYHSQQNSFGSSKKHHCFILIAALETFTYMYVKELTLPD